MKLIIKKDELSINPEIFLRRAGYGYIEDRRRGVGSFVRRLGGGYYPRLHMYIERSNDNVSFNLHLDQKQASYAGSHMHNAEYDGPLVGQEIERLKNLLRHELAVSQGPVEPSPANEVSNRSWWRRIFD